MSRADLRRALALNAVTKPINVVVPTAIVVARRDRGSPPVDDDSHGRQPHAHIAALYINERIAEAAAARSAPAAPARPRRFARRRKPEVAADLKLPIAPKPPAVRPS